MIKIRNWHEFQHFKDRCPPWIKLHRSILDQRDINMISDCAFRVLVSCWLLASEDKGMNGEIPCAEDIAFRMRIDKSKVIKALQEIKPFLIQDDITAISPRYQDDAPETETETETKTETKTESVRCFDLFWDSYPRKTAKKAAQKAWDTAKSRPDIADILQAIETQKKSEQWRKDNGKFIPYPATWLNQGRWDDKPVVLARLQPTFKIQRIHDDWVTEMCLDLDKHATGSKGWIDTLDNWRYANYKNADNISRVVDDALEIMKRKRRES